MAITVDIFIQESRELPGRHPGEGKQGQSFEVESLAEVPMKGDRITHAKDDTYLRLEVLERRINIEEGKVTAVYLYVYNEGQTDPLQRQMQPPQRPVGGVVKADHMVGDPRNNPDYKR